MLWQSHQILDVALYDLWGAMMVVHDGVHLISDCVVCLSNSNVERKDRVDDGEEENIKLCSDEPSHLKARASIATTAMSSTWGPRWRGG